MTNRMPSVLVCALLLVGLGWLATPAHAQTRAALVRDVDNPVLTPFKARVSFNLAALNDQRLLTTVPAGKRLVIEHVSYWFFGDTGFSLVFAALRTGQFGPMAEILEINPPHASATSSFTIQDASMMVKTYFEAGEEVWVTATKNGGSSGGFEIIVTGHLVTP